MPGGTLHQGWDPLRRIDNDPNFTRNPAQEKLKQQHGLPPDDEIWVSSRYQVVVRYMPTTDPDLPTGREGMLHFSIHSHTRDPMRNWRHLQAIKNEVAGEDRWAVEIFPPEEYLVDTSNEYHLIVMPKGEDIPFGFHERFVVSDQQVEDYNDAPHKGQQEPWEPGISTGGDRNEDDPKVNSGELVPPEPDERV